MDLKELAEKLGMTVKQVEKMLADQGVEVEKAANAAEKAGADVNALAEVVKGLKAELAEKSEAIVALEEKAAKPAAHRAMQLKTLAQKVMESDQYKSATGSQGDRVSVKVGAMFATKANILASTVAGLVPEDRVAGLVNLVGNEPNRMRNFVSVFSTTSDTIQYMEVTTRNTTAGTQVEGSAKKESDFTTTERTDLVKTIAHHITASNQIWSDAGQLQSYIEGELITGILDKEDEQILFGDGTGANLLGLMNRTGLVDFGSIPAGQTRLDHIRRAIVEVRKSKFRPTHIVLSPLDWAELELLKDNESRYIRGVGDGTVWGLQVIETTAMTENEFLIGDMSKAFLYDREQASIQMSREHASNFTSNLTTVLGEERLALNVRQVAAFRKGDFTQLV